MTEWISNSIQLLVDIKDFMSSPIIFTFVGIGAFVLACHIFRKVIE